MQEPFLFTLIVTGGIPVVVSYIHLYNMMSDPNIFNDANELWGGLKDSTLYIWLFSVVLTIASYFYLGYYFVWDATLESWHVHLLTVAYVLFFNFAGQYAGISMLDLRFRSKTTYLQIVLYMVALACVLITVVTVFLQDTWAIISSMMLLVHHLFFDAFYWYESFLAENFDVRRLLFP